MFFFLYNVGEGLCRALGRCEMRFFFVNICLKYSVRARGKGVLCFDFPFISVMRPIGRGQGGVQNVFLFC